VAHALCLIALLAAATSFGAASATAASPDILFVTQPPFGGDFASANAVFGNHDAYTGSTPRGGDLYLRYGDGTLRNLTDEAGYGRAVNQEISVRDPSVHWDGARALFAMVVGGTRQNDYSPVYWQIYEVTGLGRGQTVGIRRLAQPANCNNVAPLYGTDDRIIFTSDCPRNGDRLTYPQLDEYESTATVTGIWSMNPDGTDRRLLDHAPSGAFTPIIASDGRLVFTRWDHLQRDQQNNEGTLSYGAFNYASEASAQALVSNAEVFPELRRRASGSPLHGHTINVFFPWQVNEDGTNLETLNHVGRHELVGYFDSSRDGLPEFIAPQSRRTSDLLLQLQEDPLRPGYFYAAAAPEFATHASGQIIALDSHESVNAEDMQIDYVTTPLSRNVVGDGATVPTGHPGHFRDPLPLSDGTLIAVHTTSPFADRTVNGVLSSRYDFRLVRMQSGSPYWTPGARLIPGGIVKSISYWDNQTYRQLSYQGELWELDPVEVRARTRPPRHQDPLPAIETQILRDELGGDAGIARLRAFLEQRMLALIVSRNVTRRADRQQDFNLKIAGSSTQTAMPGTTPVEIAFLQLFQGDLIRGYHEFHDGRRVLAQPMHDGLLPPLTGAPPSSVRLAADGSLAAFVPARRALSWQLVTPVGDPVVRERYWVTFAAGEMRVCTNCHGVNRGDVVLNQPAPTNPPQALRELASWWRANFDDGATPAATATFSAAPPTSTPTRTPIPATATRTPPATSTRTTPPTVAPLRLDPIAAPIMIGGTSTLTGSGFTAGSVVVLFVATGAAVDVRGPFTPTQRTATSLTWQVPANISLGYGFATVVVVNTDQGYIQSNPQSQLLHGAAAANIPTIMAINGVACRPADPGVPVANVETTVAPGSVVTITGTGFSAPLVGLFSTVGSYALAPLTGVTSTRLQAVVPNDLPTGPGVFQVVNSPYVGNVVSNSVSVVLGARLAIHSVVQSGAVVTVNGAGFSSASVIALFNLQGSTVVNLGGFGPNGPRIPLTIVSPTQLRFTVPPAAVDGPAYVQVLNPPFIPYSSTGSDPDGAFTIDAP
jgi:hypothetical protein